VVLIRAMEVETDYGHMLAFGLDRYQAGYNKAAELRKAATTAGGFVVSAHPFRGVLSGGHRSRALIYQSIPGPLPETPEEALDHPVFKLADAVEVANGGTIDRENDFAMAVAEKLKLPVTGGSDAHSTHGLGKFLTEFTDEVNTEAEFLKALHSKQFHPVTGLRTGNLQPYAI